MSAAAIFKHFCTSSRKIIKPKICIIGSGPAGFYAAQYLAKRLDPAEIDIYERLPVPFGLVRFGVAPDHANMKNCTNTFTKTAQTPSVRFFGNVNMGKDVTLKELRQAYHIVLLTYGVDDSRSFNIEGNQLDNIIQAKNFVGWYNGVPWDKDLKVDLSGPNATIFGQGNVAIDIARILLSPIDRLKTTDITEHALALLAASKVKQVTIIGRRGPLQVAFTTKELRQLLTLEGCCPQWPSEDLETIPELIPQLVRPRKRLTELIVESFQKQRSAKSDEKVLNFLFRRTPNKFIGNGKVEAVRLELNDLIGDDLLDKRAVPIGKFEEMPTDLVVNSLGYKAIQADGDIPFDAERGVVRSSGGRITEGVYAAGWVAKGPSGVLMNTMEHAFGVAGVIVKHIETGDILVEENKAGYAGIDKILLERNVQVVTWQDWLKIDQYEREQGLKLNKPREKIVDVAKMLSIAAS